MRHLPEKLFSLLIAVVLISGAMVRPGNGAGLRGQAQARLFEKREVIVEIKDGASIDDINARNGTSTIQNLHGTNFYRLRTPRGKSETKWVSLLSADPDVITAALNPTIASPFVVSGRPIMAYPDDHPAFQHSEHEYRTQSQLTDLLKLNDTQLRSTGEDVVVAVIDTGVDPIHPAYAAQLWTDKRPGADTGNGEDGDHDGYIDDSHGWNFVDNNNDFSDTPGDPDTTFAGHGTFIAGLIALIAPGCQIMPVKAFTPQGTSSVFLVAAAIKFAADHGANIINLSCGTSDDSQLLRDAIAYAANQGIVVFAAVGNQDTDRPLQYPANIVDQVTGVGAVDESGHKTYFSNFGPDVSLVAPGQDLISSYLGGTYVGWSGTSFSTPLVAAAAALVLANDPDSSHTRNTIQGHAVNVDDLNPKFAGQLGSGRLSPLDALESLNLDQGTTEQEQLDLLPLGPEPAARGTAIASVTGDTQALSISGTSLHVRSTYTFLADGVAISSERVSTDDLGSFAITFSSNPAPGEFQLPDSLDPVTGVHVISVVDPQGRIVIQNDSAGRAVPAAGQNEDKVLPMKSRSSTERAHGVARIRISADRSVFSLQVERLQAGASYQVAIDGLVVASVTANLGFVGIEFQASGPSGSLPPPSGEPISGISHVALLDSSDQVVLQGDFTTVAGKNALRAILPRH